MALEVDRDTFTAAHADGALVIDAREPSEYAGGHVPGAWLRPTWLADPLPALTCPTGRSP